MYNWGCICPLTGDIHLAFDRPIPAIETAGAPAAQAAVTAALEAVFARCVYAQMFTPPRFSSPARSRASLLRFKLPSPPPRRRTPGAHAAFGRRTQRPWGMGKSLADRLRPSAVSHTNRRRPRRSTRRAPVGATPRISTQAHASHPVGRRPGDGFALHTPGG